MDENSQEKEQLNNLDSIDNTEKNEEVEIKKHSATKNYIFNMIYQVFLLIVPLVLTPYISRVLGSEGIGQYSFSYSIISYFVLFGAFGFTYYAQREIARFQNDKYNQSKVFWEMLLCRNFTVIIAIGLNLLFALTNLYGDYKILMLIMSINVFSVFFDISFFFQGNEEFGTIVFLTMIIKLIGIVSIFLFVKSSDDVWLYALINSAIILFSSLILWVKLPKYLVKVKIKEFNISRHILPSIRLFIPTIAVSVYTILDRTLIGLLVEGETTKVLEDGTEKIIKLSDIQNGYYEQSEKMVKLLLTVLTSLGAVMIPKNSFYFKIHDYEMVKNNINKAINFVLFFGFPIMFGIMAIANNFSPWFFGDGYDEVPLIIMVFSPLIMAIGLNNVLGIQYLLPAGKDNIYTISVIIGSIVNLILNLILIKAYGALGAAIASVIAETCILIFQIIYLRKEFNFKKYILPFIKYLIIGGIMFTVVYLLSLKVFAPSILNTIILVAIGAGIYGIILLIIRDKNLFFFINKVMGIIKRR